MCCPALGVLRCILCNIIDYYPRRHRRRHRYGVQSHLLVCSVCPWKMAWAINTKLGTHILCSTRSACIDPVVKMLVVKFTWLRKPPRRMVASDSSGCPVTLCCATCGHCRRGSACRYDCICFLVVVVIIADLPSFCISTCQSVTFVKTCKRCLNVALLVR